MTLRVYRRRYYPKRKKKTGPDISPYKSQLEYRLAQLFLDWKYEQVKLKYVVPHTYNPDFSREDKEWLVVEAKGRFINGAPEARKYVEVKKQHPDKEVVFIFEKPHIKAYTGLRKRKDGSVMSLGEWAAKNDFLFFGEKDVPQWFIDGDFDRDKLIEQKAKQRELYFG